MHDLPRAHVLIASHGRSGSTLLADLLTTPPERLVLNEPAVGVLGAHVREQLRRCGLPTPGQPADWETAIGLSENETAARLSVLLGPALAQTQRWGVKEVSPDWLLPSLRVFRPRQVVLLVRNLAEATASLYLKSEAARGTPGWRSEDWMLDRFRRALEGLETIATLTPPEHLRWVGYEDLVTSQDTRDNLARWLDWPLDGTPGTRMDLYGRDSEVERHGHRVTARSIGRYSRGENAALDGFVERMLAECAPVVRSRPELLGYSAV